MDALRRSLAPLLAAGLLLAAACVPSRSPVEVDYTFAGRNCHDAGVAIIQVDVAGEALTPDRYTCAEADKGIKIGSYLSGRYTVTIQGFDPVGTLLYQTTQDIEVKHQPLNLFTIDVPAVSAGGSITLLWKFAGQTCAQSGVTVVHVTLDGAPIADEHNNPDLPCRSGADGTTITGVAAGPHRIDLQAFKGSQIAYTLSNVSATVVEGQDTTLQPDLVAVSASSATADLHWTFAGLSCADGKVDNVLVSTDGQPAETFPCRTGNSDSALKLNLGGGQHQFAIQGVRGSQLVYQSPAVAASFTIGFTTQVLIDAPAASPGVGGAKLIWQFPSGGPSCTNTSQTTSISYTIKSPSGQTTSGTSTCGGSTANQGVEYCNPTSTGCPGSPGLAAGRWTISATATSNSVNYAISNLAFPVPNAEESQTTVQFAQQ